MVSIFSSEKLTRNSSNAGLSFFINKTKLKLSYNQREEENNNKG